MTKQPLQEAHDIVQQEIWFGFHEINDLNKYTQTFIPKTNMSKMMHFSKFDKSDKTCSGVMQVMQTKLNIKRIGQQLVTKFCGEME